MTSFTEWAVGVAIVTHLWIMVVMSDRLARMEKLLNRIRENTFDIEKIRREQHLDD